MYKFDDDKEKENNNNDSNPFINVPITDSLDKKNSSKQKLNEVVH